MDSSLPWSLSLITALVLYAQRKAAELSPLPAPTQVPQLSSPFVPSGPRGSSGLPRGPSAPETTTGRARTRRSEWGLLWSPRTPGRARPQD